MAIHFYEAYHFAVQVIFQVVTIGTVWKALVWLKKRRQENQENSVLDTFGNRNWHWLSGCGVVARMKRDAAYKYARPLLPPRVTGWSPFISWLCLVPLHFCYFYHRSFVIPSKQKADRILRDLFKRQLLICAPENPTLYQLKPGA